MAISALFSFALAAYEASHVLLVVKHYKINKSAVCKFHWRVVVKRGCPLANNSDSRTNY